ncbi:nicotinate (nicotinamide) nucleotide adenylyltransferase [Helicobacter cetorum]|uniref:Probable nicotinate-nucleotide adenylyltransferase n=1 Tax=Helicobacter cetorum (strain ATCC BAA-540 / CCUG 52418 / MIT 99-5656) TaxID=1163745 RepID=I0ESQ9_HELCM|nr:putative nicotinate-nucleotide adenylyltransferase [Helicobacter cetorum MIT 99-5656]
MELKELALYGGSFDPLHKAHLAIIEQTLELLPLAQLIVLPAYQNPFKKPCFLDAQTRFNELELALKRTDRVLLSDFEIKQKRAVPTIESVRYFQKLYNPKTLYLVIGADCLSHLSSWTQATELLESVELVVFERIGYEKAEFKGRYFPLKGIEVPISSSAIRANLRGL